MEFFFLKTPFLCGLNALCYQNAEENHDMIQLLACHWV